MTRPFGVRVGEPGRREDSTRWNLYPPICQYADIETIQELVRKLRAGGAKVNDSCGLHVHVDSSSHTPKTLRNIVNIMASKEDMLYKALQVDVEREHYCQKADTRFLDEMNQKRPTTMQEVEEMWYNGRGGRYLHYDDSRYHALNLHSVFSKGTIEFRLFNSTLHAGEVKSYIQLCLAISHQALIQKGASRSKRRVRMKNIPSAHGCCGWDSLEMSSKPPGSHLLKNLDGNIAWRDPAQAAAQKERLAAKRLAEQQAEEQETPQNDREEPTEQEPNRSCFFY